ncbi:MAG: NB-ARC domain-containing protein, partial [Phycisphaerae bacterium]|nr:NB-ARC domain-containing protein [Phycisphaerae bacterium]
MHYFPRPEFLASLNAKLLTSQDLRTGAAPGIVGVWGMGGIGKTVLANAVARHPQIRQAFGDGVYWLTLGQRPHIRQLQRGLAVQLGGDNQITDRLSGKEQLRLLLADRAILIILDDCWQRDHADAFNVAGPRCRILLTTRDVGLVAALAGRTNHYRVDLPTLVEARAILGNAADVPPEGLPPETRPIIKECGRLPLALALCGGMVHGGSSWQSVLAALREHDLKFLSTEHPGEAKHRDAWKAMDVSLRALPASERQRFAELAVFDRNSGVPAGAVATLWRRTANLTERETEALLAKFIRRSLLQGPTVADGRGVTHIGLHDILHHFATGMAIQQFGSFIALHELLLDAYRSQCPDGWASGPDDGYYFQNLCKHLTLAGSYDQLHAVLTDDRFIDGQIRASGAYHLSIGALSDAIESFAADANDTYDPWLCELVLRRAQVCGRGLADLGDILSQFRTGTLTMDDLWRCLDRLEDQRCVAVCLHFLTLEARRTPAPKQPVAGAIMSYCLRRIDRSQLPIGLEQLTGIPYLARAFVTTTSALADPRLPRLFELIFRENYEPCFSAVIQHLRDRRSQGRENPARVLGCLRDAVQLVAELRVRPEQQDKMAAGILVAAARVAGEVGLSDVAIQFADDADRMTMLQRSKDDNWVDLRCNIVECLVRLGMAERAVDVLMTAIPAPKHGALTYGRVLCVLKTLAENAGALRGTHGFEPLLSRLIACSPHDPVGRWPEHACAELAVTLLGIGQEEAGFAVLGEVQSLPARIDACCSLITTSLRTTMVGGHSPVETQRVNRLLRTIGIPPSNPTGIMEDGQFASDSDLTHLVNVLDGLRDKNTCAEVEYIIGGIFRVSAVLFSLGRPDEGRQLVRHADTAAMRLLDARTQITVRCAGITALSQSSAPAEMWGALSKRALELARGISNPIYHAGALGELSTASATAGMADICWWRSIVEDAGTIPELHAQYICQIGESMLRVNVLDSHLWSCLATCLAVEEGASKSRSCYFGELVRAVTRSCPTAATIWHILFSGVAAFPSGDIADREIAYQDLAEGLARVGRWEMVYECLRHLSEPLSNEVIDRIVRQASSFEQLQELQSFAVAAERRDRALLDIGMAMSRLGDLSEKADLSISDRAMSVRLNYATADTAVTLGNVMRADDLVEATFRHEDRAPPWPDADCIALAMGAAGTIVIGRGIAELTDLRDHAAEKRSRVSIDAAFALALARQDRQKDAITLAIRAKNGIAGLPWYHRRDGDIEATACALALSGDYADAAAVVFCPRDGQPWNWQEGVIRATLASGQVHGDDLESLMRLACRLVAMRDLHGWGYRQLLRRTMRAIARTSAMGILLANYESEASADDMLDAIAWIGLGDAYLEEHNRDGAERAFDRAEGITHRANERHAQSFVNRWGFGIETARHLAGGSAFRELTAHFAEVGQWARAARAAESVVGAVEKCGAYRELGIAYCAAGRVSEGVDYLNKAFGMALHMRPNYSFLAGEIVRAAAEHGLIAFALQHCDALENSYEEKCVICALAEGIVIRPQSASLSHLVAVVRAAREIKGEYPEALCAAGRMMVARKERAAGVELVREAWATVGGPFGCLARGEERREEVCLAIIEGFAEAGEVDRAISVFTDCVRRSWNGDKALLAIARNLVRDPGGQEPRGGLEMLCMEHRET